MAQKVGNGDFCSIVADSFMAPSIPSSLNATDFYQSDYAHEVAEDDVFPIQDQSLMRFSAGSVESGELKSSLDCKNNTFHSTDDVLSDLLSQGEELATFISSNNSTKRPDSDQPSNLVDAHNLDLSRTISSTVNDPLIRSETCEFSGSLNRLDDLASHSDAAILSSASDLSCSYLTVGVISTDENLQNLSNHSTNSNSADIDTPASNCVSSVVGTVIAAAASYCDKAVSDIIIEESSMATEHRQMDKVVLDLPLEVIGACWFMRRDTQTCLQAVTANDEKIIIRLNKKGSRVNMAFESISDSSSAFVEVENSCLCHIETLLEPARRAINARASTVASTPTSTRSPSKRRCETIETVKASANNASTAAVKPAATSITDITSRLRVRLSGGVKYDDEEEGGDDGGDDDGEDNGNLGKFDDDDDIDEEDEDFDSCEDTDVYEEDNDGFDEEDDDEEEELDQVLKPAAKPKCIKIQPARRGRKARSSSRIASDDDDLWTPKRQTSKTRSKMPSRAPLKLRVKIKEEPAALCVEQNVFNDDTEDEANGCTSEPDVQPKKKRSHHKKKPAEMPEADLEKPKRSHHKKKLSDESDEMECKFRKWRSKEGPKWEKKGDCPYCGVFYGNLSQHVGLYCPKNPDRQRAYHCCYCKFRSLDRASLIEHKTTHVLARDFKCEICDSAFFTRQRLVRHMRYVHLLGSNPVRIYTCDRCGKRFRYHSHYDRHLTIHSEEKSAQCDQCGKFFKNSHNVRNHQSRMHPGKPEPFPYYCEKCGQGAHSMSAHRCITPGEMHGSRRRRAPRSSVNSMLHLSTAAGAAPLADGDVSETAAACSDRPDVLSPPPITDRCSLTPQGHDQPPAADVPLQHQKPTTTVDPQIGSPQVVDCRSTAASSHGVVCRPPSVTAAIDSTPPASQLLDHRSAPNSSDRRSSSGSTPGSSAPITERPGCAVQPTTTAQAFERLGMPFDPHLIGRSSYHHLHQTESPFDRRGATSFEHHMPAMAHQPQQQPPYSNLFAVDPLLQLHAANMMYRMDY